MKKTLIPLDSNTFTIYNFWFPSLHVELQMRVSAAHNNHLVKRILVQSNDQNRMRSWKCSPQQGHHYFLSRLVVGRLWSRKVHLMDVVSGIRIRPQLQDIIRWATSFRVYFGLHLWCFICILSEQPDVMRIIKSHFKLWNGRGHVHALRSKIANALMRACQYGIGTSWWETSCNWLRTRQEPACYLWLMCALFMIINDEVECNPLVWAWLGVYTGVHIRNVWKSSNRAVLILWKPSPRNQRI